MVNRLLFGSLWLIVLLLSACSPDEEVVVKKQSFYFNESLKQIEGAGRRLQDKSLTQQELRQVLADMDDGLKLAFQVEPSFLKQLSPQMPKHYQRYFINGVKTYRLGIEAGDRLEQTKGLRLLSKWAAFWFATKPNIDSALLS